MKQVLGICIAMIVIGGLWYGHKQNRKEKVSSAYRESWERQGSPSRSQQVEAILREDEASIRRARTQLYGR